MGAVEQSYATVESYLSALDESYDSFSVNQTTLAVSSGRYEREREKAGAGRVDLYAKVTNDNSEVLHVEQEDSLGLPATTTTEETFEHAACTAVSELTGVDCRIVDVEQATILGIRDADDRARETVYRLAVVFEATHRSGTVNGNAVWESTVEKEASVFV